MRTSHRSTARFLPIVVLTFLLAACAIAPHTQAPPASATPPAVQARQTDARPHAVLLVSVDAFRADYLDRGITPNLARIVRDGARARWMTSAYPSLTFPNHWSIVTGLRPDHHGVIHNTMRDPALGTFKAADRDAVGDGRWWNGGVPIWVGAERAGIRSATMFWPGSEAAIDGVRPSQWRPFDAAVPPDARVDAVLHWLDAPIATRPRIVTLYFDEVDENGHDHGPDSPEVADAIRSVDLAIGRLLDGLSRRGTLDSTDIIVVSDHGMATVAPGHTLAVEDMVGVQEAVVTSVGQVIGIAPNPGFETIVEHKLLGAHADYDCWRKGELPPRWHYGTHPRIPPIVCQMHEGWDAVPRATAATRPRHSNRGSHGYDPALPSMRALFVARGPSFRPGVVLAPFDNVDVYPLLARLIGIAPLPNDGDIAPLLPALREAAAPARSP